MIILCPSCGRSFSGREGSCPGCGFSLTVGSVWQHYAKRTRGWLSRTTSLRCPSCQGAVPINSRVCPTCSSPITFEAAIDPEKKRLDSFLRTVKPHVKLRIQVLYVLLSGGVLWWLLDFVYQKHGQMWFAHAGASIVLLAFLSLLFFWLVPRSALIRLAHGDPKTKQRPASRIVKLGLALNFLTGLLLLQLAIGTWPMRAMVLIGLFIVSWLAFIILHSYLFPVWSWMAELFAPPAPPAYDPDARQGRNVRME